MSAPALNDGHRPVLFGPVLEGLALRPDGSYIDATFGRGGHSGGILQKLDAAGRLLALDRDPDAARSAARFAADPRFRFYRLNFSRLDSVAPPRSVDGILFDLGVSSPQLDDPARGFSFLRDGPLDMRMDPAAGISAAEWLAGVGETELARTLSRYGEERYARRIARALVAARARRPITTTAQLAELVSAALPAAVREPGKHPATRSFQALRIAVNDELAALETALEQTLTLLAPAGRLVVISFHSLEDRLVKRFMRRQAQGRQLPARLPLTAAQASATAAASLKLLGRVRPDAAEIAANVRARSAVLRVAERLT